MMKNIAECGGGQFFFIADADAIPKLVSKALEGLLKLATTNTVLKVRGLNSGILLSILGHSDMVAGAQLGDLHQENLRQVMSRIQVIPNSTVEEEEVLSFELSYVNCTSSTMENANQETLRGSLSLKFTTDEKLVTMSRNNEVKVFSVIQRAAELDEVILNHVQKRETALALQVQAEEIALLKNVLDIDRTGMAQVLLNVAENGEKRLKEQGSSSEMCQQYSHFTYMKRRGSMEYCEAYDD